MIGCQRGRLARACWQLMMRNPRGAAVEWVADHGGEYLLECLQTEVFPTAGRGHSTKRRGMGCGSYGDGKKVHDGWSSAFLDGTV